MSGRRLAHYQVTEEISRGGMGIVYRAQDTKLGREVAIKVLPEEFTHDGKRLARFEREARLLAALNHPGIATLYEVEQAEGKPFLVMELVEGETLAERIARGPLPVTEALTLSLQIAEALEAAHEKGVIHRDLKPDNIKVTPEGKAKVLDFGLAKAFAASPRMLDSSQSRSVTWEGTRAGVILGTATYMSPEQATGKEVDKRTDIFSFGVVLYEMLTGKGAFIGENVQEVLASVIKQEPDWNALPADVPPSVAKLLRRCLAKDRKDRLRDVADARFEIQEILAEPDAAVASEAVKARTPVLAWTVAAIFAIAFLATLGVLWQTLSTPEPPVRLSVNLGAGGERLFGWPSAWAVLSPDGNMLAFVGHTNQLYIRSLDSLEATPLSGTEGAAAPFFSPDGQWLAFNSSGLLKKVSVDGGAVLTIADAPALRGGTWGPDDTIVYSPRASAGLYRVPASGGAPVELTQLSEGEGTHRWPSFLPNGKAVLFMVGAPDDVTSATALFDDATIEAVLLDSGERKVVHRGGACPRYASSGHVLYAREATLFAMPFDPDRIEPTGEPSPVIEGIRRPGWGVALFAISDDGTLVYVSQDASLEEVPRELVQVDRAGMASRLTETLGDYEAPRFSPDGQRVAVRKGDPDQNIWVLELSRGTLTPLTFEDGILPLWSPDGETVFFSSIRAGGSYDIFSKPADGVGPAKQVTTGSLRVFSGSITSDGKTLVFRQGGEGVSSSFDIGMVHLEGDKEKEMLLETSFNEHTPKVSPDDQWLAYVTNESGRDEIYVRRFPTGGKWQISTEGGKEPMWSRDGRELFYRNGEKMMAVDVSAGADKAGQPTLLFEGRYDLKEGPGASNYDVTPDGHGFVMIRTPDSQESAGITQVTLVQNWFEELKRLVPTN